MTLIKCLAATRSGAATINVYSIHVCHISFQELQEIAKQNTSLKVIKLGKYDIIAFGSNANFIVVDFLILSHILSFSAFLWACFMYSLSNVM